MEYDEGNTDITLSAKVDPVISLIATSETGTHTIDKNMELSYGAHLVQKDSPYLVPTAHMYTLIPLQGHNCTQCTCKFAFVSCLKQHKFAHMKNNLH